MKKIAEAIACLLTVFLTCPFSAVGSNSANDISVPWKASEYDVISPVLERIRIFIPSNVFAGKKNSIVRVAPEIEGLSGVRMPEISCEIKVRIHRPAKLIVAIFSDTTRNYSEALVNDIDFGNGKAKKSMALRNGLTVTGMPRADIYAVDLKKGTNKIYYKAGSFIILGVVDASQLIANRDAKLPDGRLWDPFIVDGFYDGKALFDISGGCDKPVIDEKTPGAENILGGFEGGACVKIDGVYHMFPTERAGQKGIDAYYDRVKTKVGHWTSYNAIDWKRQEPLFEASGTYAVSHYDNPHNDRRGAIWSYMPIFNEKTNRWNGFYLAYTVDRELSPNHSFGRIWRCESVTEGFGGIDGPYRDCGIVMEPGLDSQPWEGRQGVDSFFPYKVGSHWLSLYGGAFPFKSWRDYPDKFKRGWWGVGLAQSSDLEGPWVRMDTTVNPLKSIHPWFLENPIVSELPEGLLIAVFDGGPDAWGLHLPNMFGYSLSVDGIHWSEARYIPVDTKVKKWWNIMRTPLCLIPEGNGTYTVVYAAICNDRRFHPMGMVKLKLNREILANRKAELTGIMK